MKTTFAFWTVLLVAVLTASACASATPSPTVAVTNTVAPSSTAATSAPIVPSGRPIATSRGPNLEATDPSSVQLASGGLELVEFFRFT